MLATDASEVGVSAVWSQKYCGEQHVVAYESRVLNRAEKNYITTEKKVLAVVSTVTNFISYL